MGTDEKNLEAVRRAAEPAPAATSGMAAGTITTGAMATTPDTFRPEK